MPELRLQDIDLISREIREQEINFSHLLEDLIDHVCCDVENEMQKGLTFSQAYSQIKGKMGPGRIKEIQQETLYAVDTKYRKMKKTMKISGIAATVMLGFAAIFKILHLPLAGILLALGALGLAFVFMPSALGVLWKETKSSKKIFLFISAFFAAAFYIMGMLFKVQHWPGAALMITLAVFSAGFLFIPSLLVSKLNDQEKKRKRPVYILGAAAFICYIAGFLFKINHWPAAGLLILTGSLLLAAVVFPWYTYITWKEEANVSERFIFMTVAALFFVIPVALVNMNIEKSYDEDFYLHQDHQQALFNHKYREAKAFLNQYADSSAFPLMKQLHSETDVVLQLINNIEKSMVGASEGQPGYPVADPMQVKDTENGQVIRYRLLRRPFMKEPVNDFLLPGTQSRRALDEALAGYKKFIAGLVQENDLQKLNQLLSSSTFIGEVTSGEGQLSLMSGLHSLELTKNSLLTVESYIFKKITARRESI